jgi:hypothetical protein
MIGQLLEVDWVDGVRRANRIRLPNMAGVNRVVSLEEYRGPVIEPTIELRVVELLAARLCHELISPVGAVNSGIELMTEFGDDPDGETMAVITSSARVDLAKLSMNQVCERGLFPFVEASFPAMSWPKTQRR